MIPKIIHYCWFGGKPLPTLAKKCIDSWRKYFPDYEICEWNESNFDVNIIPYTAEAYKNGKYAFVSDYARFWILYHYGGVYFDTDVEVIKDMNRIIDRGNFLGKESGNGMLLPTGEEVTYVNPGLGCAFEKNDELLGELLALYGTMSFYKNDGNLNLKTVVSTTTELLVRHGYVSETGIQVVKKWNIYPIDYFCPKDYFTGKLTFTDNTCSIHHFDASWKNRKEKFKSKVFALLGRRFVSFIIKLYKKL